MAEPIDWSSFTTDDLKALAAGDMSKVSTDGLKLLNASRGINESTIRGEQLPSAARWAATAAQGPTFGFGDELWGLLRAATGGNYRDARDEFRGAVKATTDENPILAPMVQGVAAIPTGVGIAGRIPIANAFGKAAATAGLEGAASGAGNAQTMEDVPLEAAKSAAIGAGLSVPMQGVLSAVGAGGRNAAARFSPASARESAQNRVADALTRDERTVTELLARLNKLGDEGMVADAAGQNTRRLLDLVASTPGKTGNQMDAAIRSRQAGRAGRLRDSAEEALSVEGRRLSPTYRELEDARRTAAGPLYGQLEQMNLPIDDELRGLLQRAQGAYGDARRIAQLQGDEFAIPETGEAPFRQLNTLKKTLFQMEEGTRNPATGKINEEGLALQNLRLALTQKLDDLTRDPKTGESLYAAARSAWAGPSEMMTAADLGYKSLKNPAWKIADLTGSMSPSEREAFRVGAFEALREKLGTTTGQSQVLQMWKEPTTREKLQEVFGTEGNFRQFASRVAAEERMRRLEGTGRGSQTFAREAGADDLNAGTSADVANAIGQLKAANPLPLVQATQNLLRRTATPEPVRDEIGRLLMLRGAQARDEFGLLGDAVRQRQTRSANRQAGIGASMLPSIYKSLLE